MDIRIAVRVLGGPESLVVEHCLPQDPGPGEVRIRHHAIGVNFIDIYHRTGLYPLPGAVPGVEASGVIDAIGDGVIDLAVGDRVVYGGPPAGSYATSRVLPGERVIRLPDSVDFDTAAASFFKSLTAHMLLTRVYPVKAGELVLVHAAAGGLGSLLVRWAKRLGAEVIGTVGSDAKAEAAKAAGVDHVIVGRAADFAGAVANITRGRGVDYAIDGIGGETLAKTLACVRKFGMVASIGQAAGPIPPLSVETLGPVRSLSLARPSVMAYAADTQTYRTAGEEVLEALSSGLIAPIGKRYELSEAVTAQIDLEGGRSMGSLLLIP